MCVRIPHPRHTAGVVLISYVWHTPPGHPIGGRPHDKLRKLNKVMRLFRKVRCITRNRRVCMDMDEASGVCKGGSMWRSVLSAHPWDKGVTLCIKKKLACLLG